MPIAPGKDPAGIRSLCGARHRGRGHRRAAPRTPIEYTRDATVRHATAHRLLHEIGCLGELVRTLGPDELLHGARVGENQRSRARLISPDRRNHGRTGFRADVGHPGEFPAGRRCFPANPRRDHEAAGEPAAGSAQADKSSPTSNVGMIAGLILGSPEFQRR